MQEAVERKLVRPDVAREILLWVQENPGSKPTDIVGVTGGEPVSERAMMLHAFLKERGF
jgi:hypothetical protein